MVLHSGDPHSWSNSLAHATFEDNVESHGQQTALRLLREDIRSWIRERKGQSHQWSLYVRDGQMITQTGVSLQEMTDNITSGPHSDLVPENIKATAPLEAATLHEATKLAMSGAERIVFPEQHVDSSGKIVARYLSVWTRNAADPTRYDGTRVDLGENIRIEDVRTGTSFTAFGLNKDIAFHQHREQKHAFVLEVKDDSVKPFEVVEKAIVSTIHRSHQEVYSHDYRVETSHREVSRRWVPSEQQQAQGESTPKIQRDRLINLLIDVPRAAVRDTAETVRDIAIFVRHKQQRRETNAHSMVRKEERQLVRLTLKKIREKPMGVAEVIEKRHAEMRKKVVLLGVIAETGVAVHAMPAILGSLAEKLPPSVRAVEKSIRRHRKKELQMRKYELRKRKREAKKRAVNAQPPKAERVETLKATKEKKKKNKHAKEYIKTPDELRRRKELRLMRKRSNLKSKEPSVKRELRPRKERRRIAGREKKMTVGPIHLRPIEKKRVGMVIERFMKVIATREAPMKKRNDHQKTPEKIRRLNKEFVIPVVRVAFGAALFLLLRQTDTKPQKNSSLSLEMKKRELPQKEETQWILLSIIWYLAMIRESGRGSKRHQPVLPVQGVIFVANS